MKTFCQILFSALPSENKNDNDEELFNQFLDNYNLREIMYVIKRYAYTM